MNNNSEQTEKNPEAKKLFQNSNCKCSKLPEKHDYYCYSCLITSFANCEGQAGN